MSIEALVKRRIPIPFQETFVFTLDSNLKGRLSFVLEWQADKLSIFGSSLVAITAGLGWYLRHYAHADFSWPGHQLQIEQLPSFAGRIEKCGRAQVTSYLNYCTFSYTQAYWTWNDWETLIDWMALHGINSPLSVVGVEKVWQNTLNRLGFSEREIAAFLPSSAFKAWWLMGNLEGWGGPVSQTYIDAQAQLQQRIVKRMRSLGMTPILQGFYGVVPTSTRNHYPHADIRQQGEWPPFERPDFLSPLDPLFDKITDIYYEELSSLYGEDNNYGGDPFHEGGDCSNIDLPQAGQRIIEAALRVSPNAIWFLQGWQGNPKTQLLQNLPRANVIVQDLDSDNKPRWQQKAADEWSGIMWAWNSITNFGDVTGMFGKLDTINDEMCKAFVGTHGASGLSTTFEGIHNNPVVNEFIFDLNFEEVSVDVDLWVTNYARRRYNVEHEKLSEAWRILRRTVYGKQLTPSQHGCSENIMCARPSFTTTSVSSWRKSALYYDPRDLLSAWKLFVEAAAILSDPNTNLQHDLVDVTRQVLSNYALGLYNEWQSAYQKKEHKKARVLANTMLQLILDLDALLQSEETFMLGPWLAAARSLGTTEEEKVLFEQNARTQITVWGCADSFLHDYAFKEWSGLIKDVYYPRWKQFFDYVHNKLNGQELDAPDHYHFESNWIKQRNNYPIITPAGEAVAAAVNVYDGYFKPIAQFYSNEKTVHCVLV